MELNKEYEEKVYSGVLGKIIGVYLGRPFEGWWYDRIIKELDASRNNKVNIEFLKEQMDKALENIEKLKDADREIVYKNGNGDH